MRLFCLFLLLAPLGLLGQSTPYYLGDGLSDFSDQMIRGTNPVYVTFFGTDSLIISTSATAYEHASVYKRAPGEPFLRRTAEWGTSLPNYVFLYEKAIFLVEKGGSYLLFHKDRNSANALLSTDDKSPIVHMKDSLRSIVEGIVNRQQAEDNRVADARNKKIVTAYIRGVHSRRDDPVLVSDIKKWSRNNTTKVYIVDAQYYITRNYRGDVLNKNIPAIIKYQLNGKCFVQWRAFGYEALGAAKFTTDLYTYNKNDFYIQASGPDGSLRLEEGVAYEIECD